MDVVAAPFSRLLGSVGKRSGVSPYERHVEAPLTVLDGKWVSSVWVWLDGCLALILDVRRAFGDCR